MTEATQFHDDTSEMTGPQLVAFFNRLAAAAALVGVPAKPVNRFADSHKGRQRCEALRMSVNDALREQPTVTMDQVRAKVEETEDTVTKTVTEKTSTEKTQSTTSTAPAEESKMAAKKKAPKAKAKSRKAKLVECTESDDS